MFGRWQTAKSRLVSWVEDRRTQFIVWLHLRKYRKHLKGINFEELLPEDYPDGHSIELTGEQQALVMIRDIVENKRPIDVFAVIESQLYETARHCPRSAKGMMFVLELCKVLNK